MIIADSDYEGPAIEALGSLFKVTQVFLRDHGIQVSYSVEHLKLADNHGSDPVPEESTGLVTPEDLELNKQLDELGLPLSFQSKREKKGPLKGKKKGKRSKHPDTYHNPADKTLFETSAEEIVSPAKFHEKTSIPLSCISMLGQSESSYCEGAMDIDMTQYASCEVDNSACSTGSASGVSREINDDNINQVAANDAQDGDFLISNDYVDLKTTPFSDSAVSAESHLTGGGVNYCGAEYDECLVDSECLKVSPTVGKSTDCETICNDDSDATCLPQLIESELLPVSSEGIGCDRNDVSNNYAVLGDWMAFWDTYYKRTYFYNVSTRTSTWDIPSGMEHLVIGGCTESDDSETLKSSEGCGIQNFTKAPEETLIEENMEGKQHEECLVEIGVAADNLVSDITTNSENQSLDHSDECLERCSCNCGISCCSVSSMPDHIICSNDRRIQVAPEVNHTPLENTAIDMCGLESKCEPSTLKCGKKVRRQRQRKLCNEAEGLCQHFNRDMHFQETPESYSATIAKYWCQRYTLFSRFDDGVKMDEEGWFSVTPEAIAQHQAIRCASAMIIDCFTGVGGNSIQFARRCGHVIGIDIDSLKIDYARHNAAIYGVVDQIDFIVGDFFLLAPKLKADTVFLSPPWGGPDYLKATTYDMKTMLRPHDGHTLFSAAKEIASRIVMFLPRNINFNQLAELSLSSSPPWSLEVEKVYLNNKLKAITAYFSDTTVGGC
ncbi:uncharacterized protein HKW66_Vig0222340 [Vigna angularis]|uniref:Trimethylguanosine synthase n=3 Tax=Phaseolus angularis TaxID=3914 RepID=A0A8T0JZU5_PHAAN|nr:uncharacterized protein LOC108338673 isoform X1 [Vigna angularis]KAG2390360.1 uncharacterized protein HKW66_Vig0222340 [Vigna angularis]